MDNLKSINNLSGNMLSIGQKLKISESASPSSGTYYTVKKGDTLYSIASKNGLTVNELKSLNNLTTNTLTIGQSLLIDKAPSPSIDIKTYTVKKGDSLYQIAKQYNTTVSNLMTINNLKSSDLSIGQKLKVPVSSTTTSQNIYTVKSGDTLYSIARANNTTVSDLIAKNNLSTSTLSVGQKLLI